MTKIKPIRKRTKSSFNSLITLLEQLDTLNPSNLAPSAHSTDNVIALPHSVLHMERTLVNVYMSANETLDTIRRINRSVDCPVTSLTNEEAQEVLNGLVKVFKATGEAINTISPNMDLLVFSDIVVSMNEKE